MQVFLQILGGDEGSGVKGEGDAFLPPSIDSHYKWIRIYFWTMHSWYIHLIENMVTTL